MTKGRTALHEILFARPMLDQRDDPVSPRPGVIDRQIVSVDLEELYHRHKASALVPQGDDCLYRQTSRLIRQGRPISLETAR